MGGTAGGGHVVKKDSDVPRITALKPSSSSDLCAEWQGWDQGEGQDTITLVAN